MRKNEIYEVLCLDVTNQGYGVVRIDGQVVFVPGLLKEEKARIKIVKVLKKYAFGKIEELQIVSKDRVEPKCPNASQCGGCCFQHLAYTKQLDIKTEYVRQLFIRNHLDCTIKDTLGMQDPFYYRNKAQFPIQVIKDTVYMGFYRPHSNSIVDCDSCVIQSKEINEVYQFIKANMNVKSAKTLRHVLIRSNVQGQVQIVFIGKENHVDALVKKITENFKNVVSILFNKNDRDDNVILGDSYRVLYGLESMRQTCMSQKIQLHFKSFFQVNSKQMEVLYSQAIHLANLSKEDRVIDLYSGVGTIGCVIAPYVKKVTGVEIVPEAVENARKNAKLNQLSNIDFVCEDASIFVQKYKEETDVVFVDPPRKGLSEAGICHITGLHPKRVVYISCNPNTLARDVKLFEKSGYHCKVVQPVDMFCHTNGLECVCLLEK